MTRFETLLEKLNAGDKAACEYLEGILRFYLRNRELHILRSYYGIGCYQKSIEEIGTEIGMENDEILEVIQKSTSKIEKILDFYNQDVQTTESNIRIKDLNYDEAQRFKKTDGSMLVSEWVKKYKDKSNKPYQALIARIREDMPEIIGNKNTDPLEPWKEILEKTPTSKLAYFVDEKEASICKNNMPERGINTLWDLHKWEPIASSPKKYVVNFQNFRELLEKDCPEILKRIENIEKIIEIPIYYEEDHSLFDNIKQTMIDFVDFIKRGVDTVFFTDKKSEDIAFILNCHYIEKLQWDVIAKEMNLGKSYIMDIERQFISSMLSGNLFNHKIRVIKEIVDQYNYCKENCLFESEDKLIQFAGNSESGLLDILGYNILELKNGQTIVDRFVIPAKNKGNYKIVWYSVLNALKKNAVVPIDKNEFIDIVEEDLSTQDITYDIEFINHVLMCDKLVDILPNDMIQLTDNLLLDSQRVARILYNNSPNQYRREDLEDLFTQQYQRKPTWNSNKLSDYGVLCAGVMWYYGIPMEPIKNRIEEFALEKKHFYFSDLEQFLKAEGYTLPKSIRTMITYFCQVDTKDNMHFCHKDYINDYTDFTWRRPMHTGLNNWILNQINELFKDKDSVLISDIIDFVEAKANGTEYDYRIRERCKFVMDTYNGDGQPFKIEGNSMEKNPDSYDSTDFSVIGRRGNYPFYTQIRTLLSYEIKKAQGGKMLLTEAIILAEKAFGEDNVSRNVVERALTNQYLQPIDIDIITENGSRILQWTKKNVKPEPTYQIVVSQKSKDQEDVREIADTKPLHSVTYRDEVDWTKLSVRLKSELSFYDHWMNLEGFNINDAIDAFLKFIKESTNSNLSRTIPQNLYEYCFASTDVYDRETYIRNLSLFYEALLAEIYYYKNHKREQKKGLYEWADEFDFANKLFFSRNSKGFDRIMASLYHLRNKLAHGGSLDMNSRETAITIADFIALYIYTCDKYLGKH